MGRWEENTGKWYERSRPTTAASAALLCPRCSGSRRWKGRVWSSAERRARNFTGTTGWLSVARRPDRYQISRASGAGSFRVKPKAAAATREARIQFHPQNLQTRSIPTGLRLLAQWGHQLTLDHSGGNFSSFQGSSPTPKALLRVAQGCDAKASYPGLELSSVFSTLKALLPTPFRSAITPYGVSHLSD